MKLEIRLVCDDGFYSTSKVMVFDSTDSTMKTILAIVDAFKNDININVEIETDPAKFWGD